MKRLHIHVGVDDLESSVRFYGTLFGATPAKLTEDYAKWMLDDPKINFAISTRVKGGVDHLGIQVDNEAELQDLRERLAQADMATFDEGETSCCYARSDKTWVRDPAGVAWEAYRTMGDVAHFHGKEDVKDGSAVREKDDQTSGCCSPTQQAASCC